MKLITNLILFCSSLMVAKATGADSKFLYHDTHICARHKGYLCLSYDPKESSVVLHNKRKLRFEIETVQRINMQLNRMYTYTKDKETRQLVKSCFVRKALENDVFGIDLAPCDSSDKELVLAVTLPDMEVTQLTRDEFVLKEVSYLDEGSTFSSELCLSASVKEDGEFEVVQSKKYLKSRTAVILSECGKDETVYGQEFKARDFKRSQSERLTTKQVPEVKAEIGRFCLTEKPDLCLGVSLENGTTLDNNRLVQVKNLTKNEQKQLHNKKMRWFHDLKMNRIASAENLDFCLEAVYNAPIGANRAGKPQYDDVVHLGTCDQMEVDKDLSEAMRSLPKSEIFYTVDVGGWKEIRTDVPSSVDSEVEYKCVSIVKCVVHDNDHCTPYNSVPVYESEFLSQGAHARLKDCDSENMVSQRFGYTSEKEITMPPTKAPTLPVTPFPSASPTETEKVEPEPETTPPPVPTPTPRPTFFVEPIAPTVGEENVETTDPEPTVVGSGLFIALGLVGLLCLLIILLAVAYYYKYRGEAAALPEEDENFIARV